MHRVMSLQSAALWPSLSGRERCGAGRGKFFLTGNCLWILGKSLEGSHTCEHLPSCVCYKRKREGEKLLYVDPVLLQNSITNNLCIFSALWGPINQGTEWSQGTGQMPLLQETVITWAWLAHSIVLFYSGNATTWQVSYLGAIAIWKVRGCFLRKRKWLNKPSLSVPFLGMWQWEVVVLLMVN